MTTATQQRRTRVSRAKPKGSGLWLHVERHVSVRGIHMECRIRNAQHETLFSFVRYGDTPDRISGFASLWTPTPMPGQEHRNTGASLNDISAKLLLSEILTPIGGKRRPQRLADPHDAAPGHEVTNEPATYPIASPDLAPAN